MQVAPIKCITVPNGIWKENGHWAYGFSLVFQMTPVAGIEDQEIFTKFPDWIKDLGYVNVNFLLPAIPLNITLHLEKVSKPDYTVEKRASLWKTFFPPSKVASFRYQDVRGEILVPRPIVGFFNSEMPSRNGQNLFENIKSTYIGNARDLSNKIVGFNGEQYQIWQSIRMDYLVHDKLELNYTKKVEDYAGIAIDASNLAARHQKRVTDQYTLRAYESRMPAYKKRFNYDPYTVLGHLMEHFEINRALGIIIDFKFVDLKDDLKPVFNSTTQGMASIHCSGLDSKYFDQHTPSSIGFFHTPDDQKRMIYACNFIDDHPEQPDTEFCDKGLFKMDSGLVTTTEILGDLISTEEKASSLQLLVKQGKATTHPWFQSTIVKSNTLFTKGFYIFLQKLHEYVQRGMITADTKLFSENNLTIGHRVGVLRKQYKQNWEDNIYSLCRRTTAYHFENRDISEIGEKITDGFIRSDAASQTPEHDVVDEKFLYWNGDHLSMESIFQAMYDHLPKEGDDETMKHLDEVLCVSHDYAPTPRLRFQGRYSFVVSNVLLNGWSVPFSHMNSHDAGIAGTVDPSQMTVWDILQDAAQKSMFASPDILFSRNEGIAPPEFLLNLPLSNEVSGTPVPGREGESLFNMVIRNYGGTNTLETCTRFIVPASVSGQHAVWHGMMDKVSVATAENYLVGDDARAVQKLEGNYDNFFNTPYLPDPLAVHLAISFYLDPQFHWNARTYLRWNIHGDANVKVINEGESFIITHAFDQAEWPNIGCWKIQLVQETYRSHQLVGAIDINRAHKTITISTIRGAELYGECSFIGHPFEQPALTGLGFPIQNVEKFKKFSTGVSRTPGTLGNMIHSIVTPGDKKVDTNDFVRMVQKIFFPPRQFMVTHATKKPLIAPQYIIRHEHNIFDQDIFKGTKVDRALIGIRQMKFDHKIKWSVATSKIISLSFPDNNNLYIKQTDYKILEFVRFEHLNGYLLEADALLEAATLSKTGDVDIQASWQEFTEGADLTSGIKRTGQFEYSYEMGLLQNKDEQHTDDLQLKGIDSSLTFSRLGNVDEFAAEPYLQCLSLLNADVNQKDSKFRKKFLNLIGTSKFGTCFPKRSNHQTISDDATMLIVPSNEKPPIIKVHKVMPLILRRHSFNTEIKPIVEKEGNQFAVYFDGPYWKTGAEERIGIMCFDKSKNAKLDLYKKEENYSLVSTVGRDITTNGTKINPEIFGMIASTDIIGFFNKPCAGKHIEQARAELIRKDRVNFPEPFLIPLDNIREGLCCWVIMPKFDTAIGKWYFDVTVNEQFIYMTHTAFLELKLIRFQPFALDYNDENPCSFIRYLFGKDTLNTPYTSGYDPKMDFRMSEIVTCDGIYLHPKRKLTVYQTGFRKVRVDLELSSMTIKGPANKIQSEFWIFLINDQNVVDEKSGKQLDLKRIFNEKLSQTFEFDRVPKNVLIKEYELFDNYIDDSIRPYNYQKREVYSENFSV